MKWRAYCRSRVRAEGIRIGAFGFVGMVMGLLWMGIAYIGDAVGLRPWAAGAIAFCICIPLGYLGHRTLTFRSSAAIRGELPKFVLTNVLGLTIASVTPEIVERATDSLALALLVTPVAVACVTYPVARFWVFIGR